MARAHELEDLLDSARSERPVLAWLKTNAWILPHTLTTVPFGRYAVAEFPFGTDYRADFVILAPFSGGCDIQFIEMEPPTERLFTRSGNPAKRLAGAPTQINNWKIFVEKERQTVLKELSKFATKSELLWKRHRVITDNVGWPLYHPQLWAKWSYHIIIGRRSTLSDRDLERKASYEAHDIDIVTYDRLIDAARKLDEHDEFVRQEFEKYRRSAKCTPGNPDGGSKTARQMTRAQTSAPE